MILEFLKTYEQASDLDESKYDHFFPPGIKRSDFLLFDNQIVCEVKGIEGVRVPNKIEKMSRKIGLSPQDLKRDLYNSMNLALSLANKQIGDTKKALGHPKAYGLIILENLIPGDLSILSLVDAADRKMISGLVNVDSILCVDFVNSFVGPDNKHIQPAQVVVRDIRNTQHLYSLVEDLLSDFCEQAGALFRNGFQIAKADQHWSVDRNGKYRGYKAKVDSNASISMANPTWRHRLAAISEDWRWLFYLAAIALCWLIG